MNRGHRRSKAGQEAIKAKTASEIAILKFEVEAAKKREEWKDKRVIELEDKMEPIFRYFMRLVIAGDKEAIDIAMNDLGMTLKDFDELNLKDYARKIKGAD